ncbi:MAG: PVC-type heme-binding CxxCH protein [Verrucomicrobiota bacterium]
MNVQTLTLSLLVACFANIAGAERVKPNVVLIFADDLGYGDLGCYGATKVKTPHLDQLAAEGRKFTDAHSASAVCTPSRYALMTGDYPIRRGLSKPVFLKTGLVIDTERQTIADVMKNAGYATACIGKWHLGFGENAPDWNGDLKPGPLELGFDYYYGVPVVNSHPPFVYVENYNVVGRVPNDPFVFGKHAKTREFFEKMGINQIGGADAAHALYDDELVGTTLTGKAVKWIKEQRENPFFLLLSTTNIHHPFTPHPRFKDSSECGPYGDFIHELDWIVGEVMNALEEQGVADNTLVIFTSDNGGMFNVGGQNAWDAGHRLNGELLGFKFGAWEGGHRVPFIARWPGKIKAGSTSDELISNVDLIATFASITGTPLEEGHAKDSVNVLPALIGDPDKPIRDHLLLAASKPTHLAIRQGKWIYISAQGSGGFTAAKRGAHAFGGPAAITYAGYQNSDIENEKIKPEAPLAQLYDLEQDLKQTQNLYREFPEKVKELSALLATYSPELTAAEASPKTRARSFETRQLADKFHSESATLADLDNDGDQDVIYGPFWYEGPQFKKSHLIYRPSPFAIGKYSNNFFVFADDLDKDGWKDVLVLGFPAREKGTYWFKNPGKAAGTDPWQKFEVFDGVENESPTWADVDGDGQKEVLCSIGGRFGFVAPADRNHPEKPWILTPITPPGSTGGKFTHGLGFGDVNGDGRNDLLEKTGWWRQPAGGGMWKKFPFTFSDNKGGSQMWAYDFDGDGDNDVVSAINAHGYGLDWFEHVQDKEGGITFKRHPIMGAHLDQSPSGVVFSQLHALRLDDVDGDGLKDIVTGKRYFAHGGKDPGGMDAPVIYWFRTTRDGNGGVTFVPYLIHDDSGVGTDVTTGDLNNDGHIDLIVGNKKGCFVHLQTEYPAQPAKRPRAAVRKKNQAPTSNATADDRIEGETLEISGSTAKVRPQGGAPYGRLWSGRTQLWWTDGKPGDVLELVLPVNKTGNYQLGAAMTKARDYGIVQLALNGNALGNAFDLYNNGVISTGEMILSENIRLEAGNHRLSVTIKGANPKAVKRHMFGLDYVALRSPGSKPPPSKKPVKPTDAAPPTILKEGNSLESEAKSPAEQQAAFELPEGFVIELVASEETGVPKPTSLAFDAAGRLWATTAVEYPRDREPEIWKSPGRDRVVVIDQPHLKYPQPAKPFAEDMMMPMGVLPFKSGAIVAQGTELLFLDDTNGDGKADTRKTLVRGFGVQDTHTMPHQLARMPGGRITFSQGVLNSGTIMDADAKSHPFDYTLVASMLPDGTDLRIVGAGMNNIWAWAHSRLGRVFIHEANDLGYSLAQFEEDTTYPSFVGSKIHPDAPFHPPTAQDLDLGGTGFSGIAIAEDRSNSFPKPWHGRLFIANPITGKINSATATLDKEGAWKFAKHENLVDCRDPMFRPVYVAFGPDDCLYIVDWYNRIISHNEVARDHPARDKENGRIWRVRHVSQKTPMIPDFTKVATKNLPAALRSDNTWAMRAAWNQLSDRNDTSVIPDLLTLLKDDNAPTDARIHALWSLEELNHFDEKLWMTLLAQPSVDLRREAVRALNSLAVPQKVAVPILHSLINESEWTVRYEVLRYLRRAEGELVTGAKSLLKEWRKEPPQKNMVPGWRNTEYLALDGSYQRAFQDFLARLAETKTQLPVIVPSQWSKVIDENPNPADPKAMRARIETVKALVPSSDVAAGKTLTEALCLTCHAIGGQGVGFAPPLDGSAQRDLDGLLTAVIDPNAAIENVFRAFRIETKTGEIHEGFRESEVRKVIALLNMGGARSEFPGTEIKSAGYIDGKSVMPDLTGALPPEQVADIIAYLRTVK